jgi:hypothetical protein
MFHSPEHILGSFWALSKEKILEVANEKLPYAVAKVTSSTSTHLGSCFLYSDRFYALTCRHVVNGHDSLFVEFIPYGKVSAATDADCDLAVIGFPQDNAESHSLPFLKLCKESYPGLTSLCAGFSVDGSMQITDGSITHSDHPHRIVCTNITDHGTSGGPCVDRSLWALIGVIAGYFGISHHRARLIPFWDVDNFLRKHPDSYKYPTIDCILCKMEPKVTMLLMRFHFIAMIKLTE